MDQPMIINGLLVVALSRQEIFYKRNEHLGHDGLLQDYDNH